jgi:hypothetical protein
MGRGMKIVIVGLPLFAERLVLNLKRFDPTNRYIFLNTYYNKIDKIKALIEVPRADLVFSINGSLNKSSIFDLAIARGVPLVMNWVGTDVLLAKEAYNKKTYISKYINKAVHFCEVSWIKDELELINIKAVIQNFASFPVLCNVVKFETSALNVLTYINDNRQEFYGIEEVLRLANLFPNINFYIVGTKAANYLPLPSNIYALGWIDKMDVYFDICQLVIRFPEHDGLANFVLESLARGKHVLYKYDFFHCEHTPNFDSLVLKLSEFVLRFNENNLKPNLEGFNFVKNEFSEDVIYKSLLSRLQSLI